MNLALTLTRVSEHQALSSLLIQFVSFPSVFVNSSPTVSEVTVMT